MSRSRNSSSRSSCLPDGSICAARNDGYRDLPNKTHYRKLVKPLRSRLVIIAKVLRKLGVIGFALSRGISRLISRVREESPVHQISLTLRDKNRVLRPNRSRPPRGKSSLSLRSSVERSYAFPSSRASSRLTFWSINYEFMYASLIRDLKLRLGRASESRKSRERD